VQTPHEQAHQIEHHARMTRDQGVERFRAHTQQLGVAQRHELRGMRIARDQRHLADGFASRHMGHEAALAALVVHEDAETTGDHQKQGEIVFAGTVQDHAARQAKPIRFREQAPQRRIAQIREQRKLREPLAQRFRIDSFATGSEG
jgi:hypothetical protein